MCALLALWADGTHGEELLAIARKYNAKWSEAVVLYLGLCHFAFPSESSISSTEHVFGSCYSEAAGHALMDTGAVHALIGLDNFLELDRKLAECGLGVVEVTAPTHVAGLGGQTKTITGVRVPVAFAHLPGILKCMDNVAPWTISLEENVEWSLGAGAN
eukprot:6492779-Amphidinium_carterae.5